MSSPTESLKRIIEIEPEAIACLLSNKVPVTEFLVEHAYSKDLGEDIDIGPDRDWQPVAFNGLDLINLLLQDLGLEKIDASDLGIRVYQAKGWAEARIKSAKES